MKLTILMAQTADGKIAKASDHPANWTSKEDKAFFVEETKKHGVIIMGANTYKTIGRPLPGRLNVVLASKDRRTFEEISGNWNILMANPQILCENSPTEDSPARFLVAERTRMPCSSKRGLWKKFYSRLRQNFWQGDFFADGLDSDIDLQLMDVRRLGTNTVLLHYKFSSISAIPHVMVTEKRASVGRR